MNVEEVNFMLAIQLLDKSRQLHSFTAGLRGGSMDR
jgi:hypothetical protein